MDTRRYTPLMDTRRHPGHTRGGMVGSVHLSHTPRDAWWAVYTPTTHPREAWWAVYTLVYTPREARVVVYTIIHTQGG